VGFVPRLSRSSGAAEREQVHLGHPLLDAFLEFIAGRARWNTVLATAFDLKVFFSIIDTDPAEVTTADVLAFITHQRAPRRGATVVRIEDGEPGLSARTIKRRLATITGLYEYLIVRGNTGVLRNPVPHGLALRRPGRRAVRGVPLIRAPRTLPRVINPEEVDALMAALRTRRVPRASARSAPHGCAWPTVSCRRGQRPSARSSWCWRWRASAHRASRPRDAPCSSRSRSPASSIGPRACRRGHGASPRARTRRPAYSRPCLRACPSALNRLLLRHGSILPLLNLGGIDHPSARGSRRVAESFGRVADAVGHGQAALGQPDEFLDFLAWSV
jgi:hypothetical protein